MSLKKLKVLTCCFVPLQMVYFFGILNSNDKVDNQATISINQKGIPLHWINDNEIVIYKNKGIYKQNLISKSEQNIFQFQYTEPEIDMYDSCFSDKYLGIKYLKEIRTKPPESTNDRTKVLFFDLNTLKSEIYNKYQKNSVLRFNIDCRPFYADQFLGSLKIETATGTDYVGAYKKFDLESKYFQKDGRFQPIVLNFFKRMNLRKSNMISSIYDSTSKTYLWYEAYTSFDKLYMNRLWPLKALWVDIEKNLVKNEILIPTGPWMKEFSFFERMPSNSPSTQSIFRLYTNNKHIYAHIQGTSVSEKKKGVYYLNNDQNGDYFWHQVISGEIDGVPILSKDGCKVLYSKRENIYIANVC